LQKAHQRDGAALIAVAIEPAIAGDVGAAGEQARQVGHVGYAGHRREHRGGHAVGAGLDQVARQVGQVAAAEQLAEEVCARAIEQEEEGAAEPAFGLRVHHRRRFISCGAREINESSTEKLAGPSKQVSRRRCRTDIAWRRRRPWRST
jgi:hypothetical protein